MWGLARRAADLWRADFRAAQTTKPAVRRACGLSPYYAAWRRPLSGLSTGSALGLSDEIPVAKTIHIPMHNVAAAAAPARVASRIELSRSIRDTSFHAVLDSGDFHLNRLGFCLFGFWQPDRQHTLLEFSRHVNFFNDVGQRKASEKRSIRSFNPVIASAFVFPLLLALALKRQHAIRQGNLYVFLFKTRQFSCDDILMIRLTDVHLWYPIGDGQDSFPFWRLDVGRVNIRFSRSESPPVPSVDPIERYS